MRLAGRVTIVTGAAGGLGFAFARRLAEEGSAVVLADLREESPEIQAFTASHPHMLYVRTDVASLEQAHKLADTTLDKFGRIDALINNAGLFSDVSRRPFEELTLQDWEKMLAVNVIGTFACTRAVMSAMKAQKNGKIINVASNVVHKGLPYLLHYVASKGAVMAMTRALARELGASGITVNAIAPGYVLHEATARTDQGRNQQVIALRALGRAETPEDLLGTIVFLVSCDSDFITGQTMVVDGGEVFA